MQTQEIAPIFVLDPESSSRSGKDQILDNIRACEALGRTLRTTLGPRGHDKLILAGKDFFVSNDGAFLLSRMGIQHPVARILKEASLAQDRLVGDGTTTVTVLSSFLLSQLKPHIDRGLNPADAVSALLSLEAPLLSALPIIKSVDKAAIAHSCAETALIGKSLGRDASFFASLVVKALTTDKTINNETIGSDNRLPILSYVLGEGGHPTESFLVNGPVFQKTFSYAGYERMPKQLSGCHVLCLDIELELKSEKETAEVRVDSPEEYQRVVEAEWTLFKGKIDRLASHASVVLSAMPVGDFAMQMFSEKGVFAAGRVPLSKLNEISDACGTQVLSSLDTDLATVRGDADEFRELRVGGKRMYKLEPSFNCTTKSKVSTKTLILRGGNKKFLEEAQRAVNDAVRVAEIALINEGGFLPGAGAAEVVMAKRLRTIGLKPVEKVVAEAFGRALEELPAQIARNAGWNANSAVNELVAASREYEQFGFDVETGKVERRVVAFEPAENKKSVVRIVVEVVSDVLSVGETMRDRPSQKQE